MEKNYYKVILEHIDFNNDTDEMRKKYNYIKNSELVGNKYFETIVVYEEDNIFKEMLTGIQITSIAEKSICLGTVYIPEYPNAVGYGHEYEIKGDYPVYFRYNITPKERDVFDAPLLTSMVANKDFIDLYVNYVQNNFDDNKSYKKFLLKYFNNILEKYNQIIDMNESKIKKRKKK